MQIEQLTPDLYLRFLNREFGNTRVGGQLKLLGLTLGELWVADNQSVKHAGMLELIPRKPDLAEVNLAASMYYLLYPNLVHLQGEGSSLVGYKVNMGFVEGVVEMLQTWASDVNIESIVKWKP